MSPAYHCAVWRRLRRSAQRNSVCRLWQLFYTCQSEFKFETLNCGESLFDNYYLFSAFYDSLGQVLIAEKMVFGTMLSSFMGVGVIGPVIFHFKKS